MASAPIAGGEDEGRIKQRYSEYKVYRRKTFKGVKNQNTASVTASITVSTTTTDKDPSTRNENIITATFSNVKAFNNNSDQAVPHLSEASEDANLSQQQTLPNAAYDADDLTRLDGQASVGPTVEATQDLPSVNGGVIKTGFDGQNRVDSASKPKQEMQELRRKFESELEIVRNLVKRIEAIQGQLNSGHSHSHVSTMEMADNGRGAYPVHSEVGSVGVPTDDSRPMGQLSLSVLENGKAVHDFMEREKRTPKANQFYRNSEFLLAKDRIPPAESNKKSKLNGKKRSRRKFNHGFGMGTKIFNACVSLLEKLMKHKHGWVFNTPVDVEGLCLHDYHSIIRHPMDLGTVKTRLNKNWYKSPKEFAEDVRLTFHNAMTYNPKGQDVHIMAEQLLKIFEDRWVVIESNYYQEMRLGMEFGATLPSSNSVRGHPRPVPPLDMRKILRRSESLINPADCKTQPMSVTPSARTPSLKKPKAKDLFKRDMTYNEKKKLSTKKDKKEEREARVFRSSHSLLRTRTRTRKIFFGGRKMAIFHSPHLLIFIFGILGNIISFFVYLAPLPTFYRIWQKKSTEGFHALPYLVALFSSALWLCYAFLKTNTFLLITINSFGCFVEFLYFIIFIIFAANPVRMLTIRIFAVMNMGLFGLILVAIHFISKPSNRVDVMGWICVAVSVSVFAAPLSILRQVMTTKSVEFMPFTLSFFLTLSAIMWFAYGLFLNDICIAIPNVVGFILGLVQMVVYAIYRKGKLMEEKLPEQVVVKTIAVSEVFGLKPNGNDAQIKEVIIVKKETQEQDNQL